MRHFTNDVCLGSLSVCLFACMYVCMCHFTNAVCLGSLSVCLSVCMYICVTLQTLCVYVADILPESRSSSSVCLVMMWSQTGVLR